MLADKIADALKKSLSLESDAGFTYLRTHGSEDRRRIVDRIRSERGSLDVLINNAGIVEGGPLEKFDDDALARTFQTNVIAPMALTRDFLCRC
jgi:NAD(P)-dependent dehydrogenase (short-subunit alcohol dehydrogenase family)